MKQVCSHLLGDPTRDSQRGQAVMGLRLQNTSTFQASVEQEKKNLRKLLHGQISKPKIS